jgi:tRNA (guanine-N7-)-methyltransferase
MTTFDLAATETGGRPVNRITTFYPRRGRVSGRHEDAFARLWPLYGVEITSPWAPFDSAAAFGRRAPLVLEIGSGMGEATVAMAAADPERDYLAVEVFPPGLGNLLAVVEERGLTNVRVAQGDAVDLVQHMLAPSSLAAVHVYFPDPWPKLRHHKRRLIQPENVVLLRDRLVPGGVLHCATDWAGYAEQMAEVLGADDGLVNVHEGFAPRPAYRPVTKFEQRGLDEGRRIFDLIFKRAA